MKFFYGGKGGQLDKNTLYFYYHFSILVLFLYIFVGLFKLRNAVKQSIYTTSIPTIRMTVSNLTKAGARSQQCYQTGKQALKDRIKLYPSHCDCKT